MKWDVAKKSKKWLKTLKGNGFRSPYQILIDNSFLKIANRHNMGFLAIKNILKGEPKLFMTKCTYELHRPHRTQCDLSGDCEIIKCGHESHNIDCSYKFIKETNPHHYILATNNICLINKLKCGRRIPVLRIFRGIPKIECFQMNSSSRVHMDEPASKKELASLRNMFG